MRTGLHGLTAAALAVLLIHVPAAAQTSGYPDVRAWVNKQDRNADGKIDPQLSDWTGAWRDGRTFNPKGALPENALTGTFGAVAGLRHDRLMVPASYASRRFWRHTAVAALAPSDHAVLGNGILGTAWDVDIDNGARPAGLIRLSETTVLNALSRLQEMFAP